MGEIINKVIVAIKKKLKLNEAEVEKQATENMLGALDISMSKEQVIEKLRNFINDWKQKYEKLSSDILLYRQFEALLPERSDNRPPKFDYDIGQKKMVINYKKKNSEHNKTLLIDFETGKCKDLGMDISTQAPFWREMQISKKGILFWKPSESNQSYDYKLYNWDWVSLEEGTWLQSSTEVLVNIWGDKALGDFWNIHPIKEGK